MKPRAYLRRTVGMRLMLWTTLGLVGLLELVGCGPVMVEQDGHRIFNPNYSFILESGSRDEWQKPDEVLAALDVGAGTAVADVGAGTGYFTVRFSRRVGDGGSVYAVDIQERMLTSLAKRIEGEQLDNVQVVRGEYTDPKLPDDCCDVVFFSSVYKEINDRVGYVRALDNALREGGKIAILEYRPGADGPGPPQDMRMTREAIEAELAEAGYALVASHDFIERQHFLVFGRRRSASRAKRGTSGSPTSAGR